MIYSSETNNFDHLEEVENPTCIEFNYSKNYKFSKNDYFDIVSYININMFRLNFYINTYCVENQPGGEYRNLGFFEDLNMTKDITSYFETTLTKDLHFYICIVGTGGIC